jgi:anthranilate phosphoribosyltransferase
LDDLRGGDKFANAEIIRSILVGLERGAKRDAVVFNAGAAFVVAGRAADILEGVAAASKVIDSGAAAEKVKSLIGR